MGFFRSWVRKKIIEVVKFAVREELSVHESNQSAAQIDINSIPLVLDKESKEEIIQRLDKQIERWTWERYKRTDNLFKNLEYDLEWGIDGSFGKVEKNIGRKIIDSSDKLGDRIVSNRNYQLEKTESLIKKWTWERYVRLRDKEEFLYYIQDGIADLAFEMKKNKYHEGEKIRIVLLYQIPSMWASWESFYYACHNDPRIDLKVVFTRESVLGNSRVENAEKFLEERNIPYIRFEEFDLENYHPHVLFIQTPYDNSQRIRAHWSARIKSLGIRICYIPYGLEITDMPEAHNEQYNTDGLINCWRIYTFSEEIKKEYCRYSLNGGKVRALGIPKFDSFFNKDRFTLNQRIVDKAQGRKIVLWKLHFPKTYNKNGMITEVTPDFDEYIKFAQHIQDFVDVFFIFMPHPLFKEQNLQKDMRQKVDTLFDEVSKKSNVLVDDDEEYRNSLLNADAIIIDRSAVMVEAGAVGVPVLFMSNPDFIEPKPMAIAPLIESYYQGHNYQDMVDFIDMFIKGEDSKKTERHEAFNRCIPYFDGNAGERIKEDIISSLEKEDSDDNSLWCE